MCPPKSFGPTTATRADRLLEREAELARLRSLLSAAAAGQGAAAFVVGPAGIGKTSLLGAVREQAAAAGMAVLAARGGELERDYAYGVVRQLFERAVRDLDPDARDAVLEGTAGIAAPALGLQAAAPDADQTLFATVHGVYWLCANLAQHQPLLLLADDLHWADDASLQCLAYLQRRVADLPVLLLGASRPPIDDAHAELLERVTGDPEAVHLAPAPLTVEAVTGLLGEDAEPEFAAACHAAAGGNPFLCETLLAALVAEGVKPVAAEAPRVTALASRAVSRDVVRRMGRLPAAVAALARAVAVLGTEAELRHAAELAGLDEPAAAAAADALAAQGLLRGAARLSFVHPLLRTAVAELVPPAEGALLHARAARLLAADGARPEECAVHLLIAPRRGDAWVVQTLQDAGRVARGHGDPETAIRYLRRAFEEPPEPEARPGVLFELGVVLLHSGLAAEAEPHLREAAAAAPGGTDLHDMARRELSLSLRMLGRYEESAAVMEELIADVAPRDGDRALGLAGELHQTAMMDPATYAAISGRYDDLDRLVTGRTRGERAYIAALVTEMCLRTTAADRLRANAAAAFERGVVEDDDPQSGLWANIAFPLVFAEGFELARAMAEAALDRGRRQGSPTALARAHTVRGILHLRTGAVREAEADGRTALEIGSTNFHTWLIALHVVVDALAERGELDAAEQVLAETGMAGEIPFAFIATWGLLGRANLRLAQGRLEEAIADYEEVGRRGRHGWRPWNPAMFPYRAPLAAALVRAGESGRALAIAEDDVELARRWGTPRALGVALRARGAVRGDLDDLQAAVDVLAGSAARVEHARALVELGAAIARTGRRVEAREPLHAGMELAHAQGATALAERAREELVAAGARPRRIMRSGVDALTPSELRVARLAADGLTNREIAQALFVTLRTVEVHLTHTYRKLDVDSREELPAALGG